MQTSVKDADQRSKEQQCRSETCVTVNQVLVVVVVSTCGCWTGEVTVTDYSTTANRSISSEEMEEWMQTGPRSMTKWVAWQAGWRLFDFGFLLEWGGRYGPALHQGQWWRWMTWGENQHTLHLLLLFRVLKPLHLRLFNYFDISITLIFFERLLG